MEDCEQVNLKLDMHMVKTLFLCNRQKTNYYLFITSGDKPFKSKDFSKALGISRVSFASKEDMTSMLQTKIGAATVFSTLIDTKNKIKIIFDKDVTDDRWYGCSDGTTTGYLKISTNEMIAVITLYKTSNGNKKISLMNIHRDKIVIKVGNTTLTNTIGKNNI